jgi:hypothetical protein
MPSARVVPVLPFRRCEKVARGYIGHAKLFDDNAAVGLA